MIDVFDTLTVKKKDVFDTLEPSKKDVFDEVAEPIPIQQPFDPSEPPDLTKPGIEYPGAEKLFARPALAGIEAAVPGGRRATLRLAGMQPGVDSAELQAWAAKIEQLPWYKKLPEFAGWLPEKVIEYKVLKGLFKALGLSKVLGAAGKKLASAVVGKELATIGGKAALKKGGWDLFRRNVLRSFLQAAPENAAFISAWSTSEAARRGQPLGPAAYKGARLGVAFSLGFPLVIEGAKMGLDAKAVHKALLKFQVKHPKITEKVLGDVEQEFIDDVMANMQRKKGGPAVKFIELPKQAQAGMKWLARRWRGILKEEARRRAGAEAYRAAPGPKAGAIEQAKPIYIRPEGMPTKPPIVTQPPVTPAKPPTAAPGAITAEKAPVVPPKAAEGKLEPDIAKSTDRELYKIGRSMEPGESKALPSGDVLVVSSNDRTWGNIYVTAGEVQVSQLEPVENLDDRRDRAEILKEEGPVSKAGPIKISPPLINEKTGNVFYEIEDGHHRYLNALDEGINTLPAMIRVPKHISEFPALATPPAAKEPWEMTVRERKAKIEQLRADNKEALGTPLMSEGGISPHEVGSLGKRQKEKYQKNAMRRMEIESQIKQLSKSDVELKAEQSAEQKKKGRDRLTQIRTQIRFLKDTGKGKSGIKPSYQKQIDKYLKERADIIAKYPELLEEYKGEKWADEALAKKPAPKPKLAPVSKKPKFKPEPKISPTAKIDAAKFERQARIEAAMTKGEMGIVEVEPGFQSTSQSVNKHIDYFENIQIPETSKIRPIQREMRRINGLRLAGKITAQEANKRVRALRTELFKTAKGEGVSLRVTKGGKLSLAVRQAGTYVPAEFSKYPKFKNIAPLFGGGQDITRAVQQMDGALTVRQKVKTKGQAGPIEKHVLWRTRDISKQKIDFIKEQTIRLRKILKVSPNSKDDTLVNNVLREIKSGQSLKEALKNPEVLKLTKKREIINQAVQLREWYDDMINDQNALREMRNQDPIPFRRNYSPEILRDATIWERVMMKDKRPREVIHGVELPDYVKPNKPFNPRELARDAGIPYEERVKSATQLARNYLITASKDIFNTSIIQNNKAFIQQLETMGLEKSSRYLADWTAEAYAGVKPALNRALPVPKRFEKEARRFNRARNIAVFPLNLSWNLTTQPSSLAFTFQKYGAWNTMKGFLDWMNTKIRKQVAKDYYSYIVKSTKHGRVTRQDVQNLIGETTTIRKTTGENIYDMTTILIHEMEKVLTGVSIRAAHHHGKARGLKGKALQEFSSDGGGKTQSMYNDEDRPALLRSLAAKTLTPYQTFNYEAVNNLREWAGRTGTPPSSQAERAMQLIRFLVAASVFRMIAKKVANKSIWSWERIPIPLAEYWLSPIIKIWNKEYTGTPSLPSPVAVMARIIRGIRDVYDTGSWRKLRRELITYGTGYLNIPGGVQINRVVEGIIAYSEGGVFDRRGRIMFKVDPDEWNEAILFGVYATRGGRKYLEKFKGKKEEAKPRRLDIAEQQMLKRMKKSNSD